MIIRDVLPLSYPFRSLGLSLRLKFLDQNLFLLNFIGWLIELSVQTVVIYRWGNFVYDHWGCTLIYRPLTYPCYFLGLGKD